SQSRLRVPHILQGQKVVGPLLPQVLPLLVDVLLRLLPIARVLGDDRGDVPQETGDELGQCIWLRDRLLGGLQVVLRRALGFLSGRGRGLLQLLLGLRRRPLHVRLQGPLGHGVLEGGEGRRVQRDVVVHVTASPGSCSGSGCEGRTRDRARTPIARRRTTAGSGKGPRSCRGRRSAC